MIGLTTKAECKVNFHGIVGYTTSNGLLLDLDAVTQQEAEAMADYINKRWRLNGWLLMQSSQSNYHLIFNRRMRWKRIVSILAAIVFKYPKLVGLQKWFILQCIKGACTLRVTHKFEKPAPKFLTMDTTQSRPSMGSIIYEYWQTYNMANQAT